MSAAVRLKELKFKNAILIDDAFAPPEVTDIDGEAITLLNHALSDEPTRVTELQQKLEVSLDPRLPEKTSAFLGNATHLERLWALKDLPGWQWLQNSVFHKYQAEVESKCRTLQPIIDYFEQIEITVSRFGTFGRAVDHITDCDIVFLDFFLKGEILPDLALERASQLSQLVEKKLMSGGSTRYPLFVLFSSRSEAVKQAEHFKEQSTIRGCFFQFLPKNYSDISGLEVCLARMLPDFQRNQDLANLLDGYCLGAYRAAYKLKRQVQRLEPADVSLLNGAALMAENERFGNYLTWLTSVYLSTVFASDDELKARSQDLSDLSSKMPLPGHIPAGQAIADLFISASLRDDVGDQSQYSMQYEVGLGDIFVEGSADSLVPNAQQLLVVIDQSCDLAHAGKKARVLCLRGSKLVETNDVALAVYHPEKWPTYFLWLYPKTGRKLYRVTWNLADADAIDRIELDQRQGFARIARLQDTIALQLQHRYLSNLGRIGTAVQPPMVGGYSARLRIGKVSFDALGNPWTAVTVVQGRTPKQNDSGAQSATSLDLYFCAEFVDWLLSSLPNGSGASADVIQFRKVLSMEGGPRGRLSHADDISGPRKLTIGASPAITVEVVMTEALFAASTKPYVMQIVTTKPTLTNEQTASPAVS